MIEDDQKILVQKVEKTVTHTYHWQQQVDSEFGFYVFDDHVYRVGIPMRFTDMTDADKQNNCFCATRHAYDAAHICELLNEETTDKKTLRAIKELLE